MCYDIDILIYYAIPIGSMYAIYANIGGILPEANAEMHMGLSENRVYSQ